MIAVQARLNEDAEAMKHSPHSLQAASLLAEFSEATESEAGAPADEAGQPSSSEAPPVAEVAPPVSEAMAVAQAVNAAMFAVKREREEHDEREERAKTGQKSAASPVARRAPAEAAPPLKRPPSECVRKKTRTHPP